MAIKIKPSGPDVVVTEGELARHTAEYQKAYMHYAGTPPTLEEYIRRRQREENK